MTIDIQEPALERRIHQLMGSGAYASVEELLREMLAVIPDQERSGAQPGIGKESLGTFLRRSPLWGSGLQVERIQDEPRIPEL